MHGWKTGEEESKRAGRHMWTVPSRASIAGDGSSSSSSSSSISANSFNKVFHDVRFLFYSSELYLISLLDFLFDP